MPAIEIIRLNFAHAALLCGLLVTSGCASNGLFTSSRDQELDHVIYNSSYANQAELSTQQRLSILADQPVTLAANEQVSQNASQSSSKNSSSVTAQPSQQTSRYQPAVFQQTYWEERQQNSVYQSAYNPTPQQGNPAHSGAVVRGQSPDGSSAGGVSTAGYQGNDGSSVQPTTYQYLDFNNPGDGPFGMPSPTTGSPNEQHPLMQQSNLTSFPQNYADLDVYVSETQTGKINFGGAYNSDNGIVGQFIIDERNFDINRFPRSFRDITDGTAWRGAGQTFRLELVPGANLQRYLVSFSEPHFRGSDYSFSASGYLFERQYFDWDERRLGGRFALGRRLTPDLSISMGLRLENVDIDNLRVATSPELNASAGNSNLFLGNVGLIRDTRDHPFLSTTGSYFSATYSQAFGDYSYARGDVDYRRYRLMYERPDGSGRHTLSFGTKLGFSGSSTPIFENYFAGGFSTLRGFDFRGAAPLENGVRVGGEFQWLNSLEYTFPLTADDMIKGVAFCDFGTVESGIELNAENFRVAPGFGFRVNMPAAGIGAPLAFDFAFPISTAEGDDEKIFSFYLGVLR